MAVATITQVDRFPTGTTVSLYRAEDAKLGQAPSGSAVTSGTMGSQSVTFTELDDNKDFVAYALVGGQHLYTRVQTRSAPSGSDSPTSRLQSRVGTVERGLGIDDDPPAGESLWTADCVHPWQEEWANMMAFSPQRFNRVPSPLRRHRQALRVDLTDGDAATATTNMFAEPASGTSERAELATANPSVAGRYFVLREGDEIFHSYAVYLGSTSELPLGAPFCFITQWKQLGASPGSPAAAVDLRDAGGAGIRFTIRKTPNTDPTSVLNSEAWAINVPRSAWHRFTYRIKFSRDPAVGFVQVYGNITGGTTLTDLSGQVFFSTMKDADSVSGGNLWLPGWDTVPMSCVRQGVYRDPAITGNAFVIFDGINIASTRELAEHLAFT